MIMVLATLQVHDGDINDGAFCTVLMMTMMLSALPVDDKNLDTSSSGNSGLPAVAAIKLYYNDLGVGGGRALAETPRLNSTLTSIDLGFNGMGEVGGRALAETLRLNSTVVSLNLYHNHNLLKLNQPQSLVERWITESIFIAGSGINFHRTVGGGSTTMSRSSRSRQAIYAAENYEFVSTRLTDLLINSNQCDHLASIIR